MVVNKTIIYLYLIKQETCEKANQIWLLKQLNYIMFA